MIIERKRWGWKSKDDDKRDDDNDDDDDDGSPEMIIFVYNLINIK